MADSYDVIVVGAGPAGSATARDVARAGLRVLLLEAGRTVGLPVQCSGFVSPRTLELAGVAPAEVVIDEVRGAWVHTASGARLQLGGARTYAYAMDRARFDQLLAAQAEEAGAELRTATRLTSFTREGGMITARLARGSHEACVRAPLLIGADGVHSTVSRAIGRPRPSQVVRALGAELACPPAAAGMVDLFVGRDLAPGWFGWSIPLGASRVRVGIGTTSDARPADLLAALREAFPAHLAGSPQPRSYSAGLIPLWEPRSPVEDGVMLVGDAAGQVKPSTGGGIHSGLVGARDCAAHAIEATRAGRYDAAFLAGYEVAWEAELASEFRDLRRLRSVFLALSDRQVDWLVRLLARPRLQRIIAREGDIDFPSRMFLSLARAAPELLGSVPMPWLDWARARLGRRPARIGVSDNIAAGSLSAR